MPAERTKDRRAAAARPKAPTAIAFVDNITPGTFTDPPSPADAGASTESLLFPPAEGERVAAGGSGKKSAHSKRKGADHIPRPPNAFILFRSSFIKSQHVSTEVETNHSTLSKIIGLTWQNLPPDERQVWHAKAKAALDEHRRKWPSYAFRPLHPKHKSRGDPAGDVTFVVDQQPPPTRTPAPAAPKPKAAAAATREKRRVKEVGQKDLARCAKIAELLVEGKKGAALDAAMAEFDANHVPAPIVARFEEPLTSRAYRRSSSAPIPDTEHSRRSQSFLPGTPSPPQGRRLRSSSSEPEPRALEDVPEGELDPSMPPLVEKPYPRVEDDGACFDGPAGQFSFSWPTSTQACDFSAAPNPAFCFESFSFDQRIPTPLSMHHLAHLSYTQTASPYAATSPVSPAPTSASYHQPQPSLSIDTSFAAAGTYDDYAHTSPYSSVPCSPGAYTSSPSYHAPAPRQPATPAELLAAFSEYEYDAYDVTSPAIDPQAYQQQQQYPAPASSPLYSGVSSPAPSEASSTYASMYGAFQVQQHPEPTLSQCPPPPAPQQCHQQHRQPSQYGYDVFAASGAGAELELDPAFSSLMSSIPAFAV